MNCSRDPRVEPFELMCIILYSSDQVYDQHAEDDRDPGPDDRSGGLFGSNGSSEATNAF